MISYYISIASANFVQFEAVSSIICFCYLFSFRTTEKNLVLASPSLIQFTLDLCLNILSSIKDHFLAKIHLLLDLLHLLSCYVYLLSYSFKLFIIQLLKMRLELLQVTQECFYFPFRPFILSISSSDNRLEI